MFLLCAIGITLAVSSCHGYTFKDMFPAGRTCGAYYGDYYQDSSWVCDKSEYQTPYPEQQINTMLGLPKYKDLNSYFQVTKNCHGYTELPISGNNEYYSYQSLCASKRKPVHLVWAKVPNFPLSPDLFAINQGLLPCHVLEGQSLFQLECVHPWSIQLPPPLAARFKGRNLYPGAAKHFCHIGYNYNRNYMCRPDQYVTREVLVYSQHADMIFRLRIPNVPTTCSCGTCYCDKTG